MFRNIINVPKTEVVRHQTCILDYFSISKLTVSPLLEKHIRLRKQIQSNPFKIIFLKEEEGRKKKK